MYRYRQNSFKCELIINQKGRCYICGQKANTIDHIIPQFILKIKGISVNWQENKKLCCVQCNNKMSKLQSAVCELVYGTANQVGEKKLCKFIFEFYRSDFGRLVLHRKQFLNISLNRRG